MALIDQLHPITGWQNRPLRQREDMAIFATCRQARPRPILSSSDERCPERVGFDVTAGVQKVAVRLNREGPIAPLINASATERAVLPMPAHAVSNSPKSHEFRELTILIRAQHQVKVIGHQAECEHVHGKPVVCFRERLQPEFIVAVVFKQREATHRTIDNVKNETRCSNSLPSRHSTASFKIAASFSSGPWRCEIGTGSYFEITPGPYFALSATSAALLPAPVAITTNCVPALVRYVIGVPLARRGSSFRSSSLPVFAS